VWKPPPEGQRNGIVKYYNINVNSSAGEIREETSNATQFNLTSLEPYNNYSVSIAAVTVNVGPYTLFHLFQTGEAGRVISTKFEGMT